VPFFVIFPPSNCHVFLAFSCDHSWLSSSFPPSLASPLDISFASILALRSWSALCCRRPRLRRLPARLSRSVLPPPWVPFYVVFLLFDYPDLGRGHHLISISAGRRFCSIFRLTPSAFLFHNRAANYCCLERSASAQSPRFLFLFSLSYSLTHATPVACL